MAQTLQDDYLHKLKKHKVPVAVYLINGIKLLGHIQAFDDDAILLKNTITQLVYKCKISTVMPNQSMGLKEKESKEDSN